MRHLIATFCSAVIGLSLGPTRAAADEPPAGELIFLNTARRAVSATPVDPALARTYRIAADALVPELDQDVPRELRRELLHRIGDLLGRAWASGVPTPVGPPPPALARLIAESEAGNRAATAGLRYVVDALVDHAKADARVESTEVIERSLLWLGRIGGPLAGAGLFAVSREAAHQSVREGAVTLLAALARIKAGERYAEACARLLLE